MKKHIRLLALLSVFILSAGCLFSNTPTAEELLSQHFFTDTEFIYTDIDLKMNLETQVDMGDFIGEELSAEETLAATILVNTELNVKNDGAVQYLDGVVNANFFGYELTLPATNYTIVHPDSVTVYDFDYDSDCWIYNESTVANSPYINFGSFINYFNTETLSNYKLLESEKDDVLYHVSGTIGMEDLMEMLETTDMFEDTFSTSDLDMKDAVANVMISYDKKTLLPVSYNIESNDFANSNEPTTKLAVYLTINTLGAKDTVIVPQNIIDSATYK